MYYKFKGLLLIIPITETPVDLFLFLQFSFMFSCLLLLLVINFYCMQDIVFERVFTEIIGSLG